MQIVWICWYSCVRCPPSPASFEPAGPLGFRILLWLRPRLCRRRRRVLLRRWPDGAPGTHAHFNRDTELSPPSPILPGPRRHHRQLPSDLSARHGRRRAPSARDCPVHPGGRGLLKGLLLARLPGGTPTLQPLYRVRLAGKERRRHRRRRRRRRRGCCMPPAPHEHERGRTVDGHGAEHDDGGAAGLHAGTMGNEEGREGDGGGLGI